MTSKSKFDPVVAVFLRNVFYKRSYQRILVVLFISFVINLVLAGSYYYLITHPRTPVYFATTVNGRILPVYPLSEPNRSDREVLNWATSAAMAAFTYNYANYRREFQASSDFFSPWGWTQFLNAIKDSNNLDAVKVKKLVVSAQLSEAQRPSIKKSGLIGGRFAWRIKVPLLVTYQSTEVFSQQKTLVTLLVVRLSNLNSPSGLGIEQFVVAPIE